MLGASVALVASTIAFDAQRYEVSPGANRESVLGDDALSLMLLARRTLSPELGALMKTHVDVLIAGAGISGIAAAYYLQKDCPEKSFAIVEARDTIGGTWSLFRYPGIRSDSDMYTFGYSFYPWRQPQAMAPGSAILEYLGGAVEEFGIADKNPLWHTR